MNTIEPLRKKKNTKVLLRDGEYLCDVCNGWGIVSECGEEFKYGRKKSRLCMDTSCPKCNGEKKLDWVENICGKKAN